MFTTRRLTGLLASTVVGVLAASATLGSLSAAEAATTATDVKPALHGLLDREGIPRGANADLVDGFVIDVPWRDVQPKAFGAIAENNEIDAGLAVARRRGLQVKLRVRAGIAAPAWAKNLGGAPVESSIGTYGRFWTSEFGRAYDDLQTKLAARYDAAPEVAETIITRCTTAYGEPFIRQAARDRTPLVAAGFTPEADIACLNSQVTSHQVWQHTRSGLALNPYQYLNANGTSSPRVDVTVAVADGCRATLGERCVLENNSIRWSVLKGQYTDMYKHMTDSGSVVGFQTAAPERIGDWLETVRWAAGAGGSAVELNRDYDSYDRASLIEARARLLATSLTRHG